jgi:hypothetical protein
MARERGRPGQYEGEWLQWGAPYPLRCTNPLPLCGG